MAALPQPCPELVEGKAKRTIRGYTTDIGQLLDFMEQEGRLEDRIDTDDLIDFPSTGSGRRLAEQQKAGVRSRTLDRKRSAFKAFFGYLVRFKRIDADPARRLGVPIADYELPLTLTESEVEGLLEAAQDHPRDLAITSASSVQACTSSPVADCGSASYAV